ncbi:MAG: hypothetical protein MUP55_01610 [Candidatus Aenigmarchaeota archaeon]|nr:hypothetical protein [Candidatus Aenigmarchaeota archaeon]
MKGKCPYIDRNCTDECKSYIKESLMTGIHKICPEIGENDGASFHCYRIYNEVLQSVRNAKEINKMNKIK